MNKNDGFPQEMVQCIQTLERAIKDQEPREIDDLSTFRVQVDYRSLKALLAWLTRKKEEFDLIHEMTERLRALHPNRP